MRTSESVKVSKTMDMRTGKYVPESSGALEKSLLIFLLTFADVHLEFLKWALFV